jgi:hypothetical protein
MLAGLLLAAPVFVMAVGPGFGTFGREKRPPPQPYTEQVAMPGKPPQQSREIVGAWELQYELDDAPLEDGRTELLVHLIVDLREDGSYMLHYSGRWGGIAGFGARGIVVNEQGSWSLSTDVLLLEPARTGRSEVHDQTAVNQKTIANENHVLIVSRDGKYLHAAGRCAKFQIDPICRTAPNIWYTMRAELGRRWLQRS